MTTARRTVAAAAFAILLAVPAAAQPCPDCLSAGAATVALPVPSGTPLAGYGALARRLTVPDIFGRFAHALWFKPHEGQLDPVSARALVLERDDVRVVWVAVDLIAVDHAFTSRVKHRLVEIGVPGATVIVSASHTHSGPGAFLDSGLFGLVSVEREDADVRDTLVGAIVEAVRRAEAAKQPAYVGVQVASGPDVTVGRLAKPVDRTLGIVKIVRPTGTPVAVLWNYAIHGTMLGPGNLKLSADVMGYASREIETQLHAPALFVNGAVGDVSPAHHGITELGVAGHELASAVLAGWDRIPATPAGALRTLTTPLKMPEPRLSPRNCVARWLPRGLSLPLGPLMPRQTELTAVAIGATAWTTIPGELQSQLADTIRHDAAPSWKHVLIAGVSNDYLGYFLTTSDASEPSYVSCANLYGPGVGVRVTRAAVGLLRRLADGAGR